MSVPITEVSAIDSKSTMVNFTDTKNSHILSEKFRKHLHVLMDRFKQPNLAKVTQNIPKA
jgi:hypothetical protein